MKSFMIMVAVLKKILRGRTSRGTRPGLALQFHFKGFSVAPGACAIALAKEMRRKVIQHYADVLCHMASGWRMGDDLEILADLPSGRIHFDIIEGCASHYSEGEVALCIAGEMKAWFRDRIAKDGIPMEAIQSAVLDVDMDSDRIKTDKKRVISFDWRCHSQIVTAEKTYEAELRDRHAWHSRSQPNQINKKANKTQMATPRKPSDQI